MCQVIDRDPGVALCVDVVEVDQRAIQALCELFLIDIWRSGKSSW
jgi:hypothetical protein